VIRAVRGKLVSRLFRKHILTGEAYRKFGLLASPLSVLVSGTIGARAREGL
jgi:hypothetical protein